ncbi:MAG: hypothetical protein ACI9N1_001527 [Flavobacteriales bacterium]|jgi:hypothetical protein
MDTNKIIGLSSKVLIAILGIVGVIMCIVVLKDGNPNGWNEQDRYDLGQVEVAKGNDVNELSPRALDQKIKDEGKKIHEITLARQKGNAKSTLVYTKWVLILAIVIIVGALILAIVLAPKRFIIPGIAIVVFGLVLMGIYYGVGDEVPEAMAQIDADNFANATKPEEFTPVFTADSWRLAGAAIVSSLFLAGIAIVGIIVASVVKLVK